MKTYFVPILFLLGTCFFGYLYLTGSHPDADGAEGYGRNGHGNGIRYGKLEQYKKEAQVKMDIQRQRAEMEKSIERPLLNPNYGKENKFHEAVINTDVGPAAYDTSEEGSDEPVNLDQQLDAFLAEKQRYEELEVAQRQSYVQAFIREAFKMGYKVQVNDQMEIVSVEKTK